MTLNQLAASLATPRRGARSNAPASRLAMEAMAARVAHTLRKEGGIRYFAPVAAMPGFSKALTATLTELRLEKYDAAKLRSAGEPGKDLAALLALYEEKMDQASLADLATLLRLATDAALEGKHRFANLPLILFDPPLDSACARDLVAALASRSPRVLEIKLAGDGDTIEPAPVRSQLDRVRASLFAAQAPESSAADESLDYFSAPGEGVECVEIARRIRQLTGADVPFDRIAVLLRDPERYQPFLEEALRRARVPAYFSRGVVRPEPAGRAFLALLGCAREGCSATRFSEYLSLGQVPSPDAPADDDDPFPLDDEVLASFVGAAEECAPEPLADNADDNASVIGGTLQSPIGWGCIVFYAAVIGGVRRWERRVEGVTREAGKPLGGGCEKNAGVARPIWQRQRAGKISSPAQ